MERTNKTVLLKSFGQAVRARRTELNMTQEDLAHASNLDRTYIGGVERGERNLSLANIHRIAVSLHISAASLMKLAERSSHQR
jgi:transcriptional regulator with XRE-family HTH domain